MKILFAASEMTPYAKTGGLGDVVGALAGVLSQLGHEVTCCLPFYRQAREAARDAKPIGLTLSIPLGSRTVTGDVLELRQRDGVRVLFVRRDEFFDRSELYHTGLRDYEDNAERFLFFSKAVVELIGYARFRADVVHCHDWQTALVPAYAKATAFVPVLARAAVKTVLTIHNIAYQGMFPSLDFPLTNLPGEFFTPDALEYYEQMNLLKGGIVFADAITTVSRTYAQEIQTAEGGCGLDTVLGTRADDLHGIVNGVDYACWNPETDPHLRHHYHLDDVSGKQACRADLLAKLGLEADITQPVAAFVSRLTEQKGVEVLAEALEDLVTSGVTLAILGKGERKYEELLAGAAAQFPGRVAVTIAHDEALAHQMQAGADILLMPSHFEPCGLTQLYALKYGTIPVVHATGGLEDTVAPYHARTGAGTGFKFAAYTPAAFVGAVQQAILLHKQPKKWQKLMRNAMACDFSWQASAKEYEKLYATL
jgi:starch synthase